MTRNVSRAAVVLSLLLAGLITTNAQRDYRDQSLDLIRFLATKPWAGKGHNRWDRSPHFDVDLTDRFSKERWGLKPKVILRGDDDSRSNFVNEIRMDPSITSDDLTEGSPKIWGVSSKRSAVATALNGRRRRQPAPALGVLNDVGNFFDSLRDNLENLASLSPQQRTTLFTDTPNVVLAPPSGGSGGGVGGSGIRRLHALRPLRPTGNIRTYNRRSFVETDGMYPGANHHDPGLLWTGLGRR